MTEFAKFNNFVNQFKDFIENPEQTTLNISLKRNDTYWFIFAFVTILVVMFSPFFTKKKKKKKKKASTKNKKQF